MKKVLFTILSVLLFNFLNAQVPEKFSYQAVIRDHNNELLNGQVVGMQISILKGSITGTAVYVETQSPTTNSNGLISIEIGTGVSSDDFSAMNWSDGPYFIKTEIDPAGGKNYSIIGTSQLISVPFALHAKTAENITGTIAETDPNFTAWDKTSGIVITEDQISDLQAYVTSETDPVYGSSVAGGITAKDTTLWNNKLDNFTETDPLFSASVAAGINNSDTSNWNNKLDSFTEVDPIFSTSVASGISNSDTASWNNKLDSYTETQTLSDVISNDNTANGQIKDLTDPTEAQDAATKAYVDLAKAKIIDVLISNGLFPVNDIDGNSYTAVVIGDQVWMAENLRTTKYNDGTPIPLVTDNNEWKNLTTPAYCWYDNDESTYKENFGAFYTLYTVQTEKLCPQGWHVPTKEEWDVLKNYLGLDRGGKLKEAGTVTWDSPNTGATNESGFTALGGGIRNCLSGQFEYKGTQTSFWSSNSSYFPTLSNSHSGLGGGYGVGNYGRYVRCLMD